VSSSVGLIINAPNVLLKKFNINLDNLLIAVKNLGRIVVGKVILNQDAPQKPVKTILNYGLEPVLVNGCVDVAFTVEAMKLIYNPRVSVLALGGRDSHFLPILFEAKKVGKEVIIIGPSESLSIALQNTADEVVKL